MAKKDYSVLLASLKDDDSVFYDHEVDVVRKT